MLPKGVWAFSFRDVTQHTQSMVKAYNSKKKVRNVGINQNYLYICNRKDVILQKMKTASYYLDQLKQYKESNAMRLGIHRIGIFGSVARGEQNDSSDLDVFVDIEDPDYFVLCDIHDDLEKLCGCKVDLVHIHRFLRPLFLKNLEKDAILA